MPLSPEGRSGTLFGPTEVRVKPSAESWIAAGLHGADSRTERTPARDRFSHPSDTEFKSLSTLLKKIGPYRVSSIKYHVFFGSGSSELVIQCFEEWCDCDNGSKEETVDVSVVAVREGGP